MKALHVIPSLSPTQGGPSFALPLMERGLVAAGVDVTVATTDDDGAGAHLSVPLGHPTDVDGSARFFFRKQIEFYKCSLPLFRWLSQNVSEFDVVHVHALFSFASVAAARCARRENVPYIVRPLGVLNEYGMTRRRRGLKAVSFRLIEGPLLQRAAAIHYTSDQERREAEALGVTTKPFVAPIGLDLSPFRSLPAPEDFLSRFPEARGRDVVLFLSRLDPKKGLDLLLDAFAMLKRRRANTLLVIAGSGEDDFVASLRERAASAGVSADVVWTGFLHGPEKLAAFAAASVFVLPSYSENFGIAAVEGLAAGVPTVLTQSVGIAGEVAREGAGIVVPEQAEAIAEAILQVLEDDSLGSRLSRAARQLAERRFSMETMGLALRNLYEEVCAPSGASHLPHEPQVNQVSR